MDHAGYVLHVCIVFILKIWLSEDILVSIMMVLKVSCFRELLGFAKFEEHEKSDSFDALECGFRSSEKSLSSQL